MSQKFTRFYYNSRRDCMGLQICQCWTCLWLHMLYNRCKWAMHAGVIQDWRDQCRMPWQRVYCFYCCIATVVSLYVECISSFMHVQICGFENFLQLKRCMHGCTVAIGHHAEEGIGCMLTESYHGHITTTMNYSKRVRRAEITSPW